MNKLSDLTIKPVYDTDDDVEKLYNSVLERAVVYKRASAYFSSGFYNYIEKGLNGLLKNNGKMKLILSTEIDHNVWSEIKKGYFEKNNGQNYINQILARNSINFDEIKSKMSILSFLIAIDRLDIRFAFKESGLYHDKYSIISDLYGNKILLSGSNNETEASIKNNHESFQTTYNWDSPSKHEIETIAFREQQFDKTWNNEVSSLVVLPLADAIKQSIIEECCSTEHNNFPLFMRVDLIESKLLIQTNANVSKIAKLEEYKWVYKNFVEFENNNRILFKKLNSFQDVNEIVTFFKKYCELNKICFAVTEILKKYLNINLIDFDSIAPLGTKIKDHQWLKNNDDFIDFCKKTQNLVKRPLKFSQLQAAYHIVKLGRSFNFSVPGSGKTSAVIGAFEYLNSLPNLNNDHIDKILIFGPINCFNSWEDEFNLTSKQSDIGTKSLILNIKDVENISSKITMIKYGFDKAKIILINYEIITSISEFLARYVNQNVLVVFDEIHRLKNYQSKKLPECIKIIKKTKFRVALTGTPLPNGYKDLLSMFTLIYGEYANSYFGMNEESLKQADQNFDINGIQSDFINNKIFPFFIRTTKKDLDVPEANPDNLIVVDASDDEEKIYSKILEGNSKSYGKIIKLSEVSCLPDIAQKKNLSDSEVNEYCQDFSNEVIDLQEETNVFPLTSKFKALLNLIEKNEGKAIIWCIYTQTINRIYKLLTDKNLKVAKIFGATPINERQQIIANFNTSDKINILITNPSTLAESVSLHKACHTAYYLEINYNLSQYLQSRDRIHRLGLLKSDTTNYYIFITKYFKNLEASIDNIIYSRLGKKELKMTKSIDAGSLIYNQKASQDEYDEIIKSINNKINDKH